MVGGFATQLAIARGARVVAAVRDSDAEDAHQLGAETIVSTEGGLEAQIRGQWQHGVDACLDTIGLGADALACVRDDGSFVTSVPTAVPDAQRGIDPGTVQVQPDSAGTTDLVGRAEAGELTVRVAKTLPLERFHEAYARLERGGVRGKIVLTL
jgi:NADPH:quinone reductase-like Zn-dependent oxidoreductase